MRGLLVAVCVGLASVVLVPLGAGGGFVETMAATVDSAQENANGRSVVSRATAQEHWLGLLLVVTLIVAGGLMGGHVNGGGKATGGDAEVGAGSPGRGGLVARGRWAESGPYVAGVAGAIVAVVFVSGPIEYNYDVLLALVAGHVPGGSAVFTKFVTGMVMILAVATVGGYLGVELLESTARNLLKKVEGRVDALSHQVEVVHDDVEGRVDALSQQVEVVHDDVDVERLLRESRALLVGGDTNLAWERLQEMPPEKPMRDFDRMNLHLLRGYAMKRLGMLDDALREVDAALTIKESYGGWYNKACYTALRCGSDPTPEQVHEVSAMMEKVRDYAAAAGPRDRSAFKMIRGRVLEDIQPDGDLYALREHDFIKSLANPEAGRET